MQRQDDDGTLGLMRASEWGYASIIPGLQFAVDSMQKTLDEIRAKLATYKRRN